MENSRFLFRRPCMPFWTRTLICIIWFIEQNIFFNQSFMGVDGTLNRLCRPCRVYIHVCHSPPRVNRWQWPLTGAYPSESQMTCIKINSIFPSPVYRVIFTHSAIWYEKGSPKSHGRLASGEWHSPTPNNFSHSSQSAFRASVGKWNIKGQY